MQQIQINGDEKHNAKDRFILRFHDEGQRAELKARAALNKRSLNAELLVLIEVGIATADRAAA